MYASHLNMLVRMHAERKQYFATFFLRNRAELELMERLINQKAGGSNLDITVLACSKGAEVYSIARTLRRARPDLKLRIFAIDVSQEILEFAERGLYSLTPAIAPERPDTRDLTQQPDASEVAWNTGRDQQTSIFERVTDEEMHAMFDVKGDQAAIKAWLKQGITWTRGDAGDPELFDTLGPQDLVVANRFLCHMEPSAARQCLRNIGRLVKPGGYLFVSGIDLDVRTRVAREMGWTPVTDLIREVHEGDTSLRRGWPLEYWSLEPFCEGRSDWRIRYASVFQVGKAADSTASVITKAVPQWDSSSRAAQHEKDTTCL